MGQPSRERPSTPAPGSSTRLLTAASRVGAEALPALIAAHARSLGALDATIYLADLQQQELVPFLSPGPPGHSDVFVALSIDSTLAGRCFQLGETFTSLIDDGSGQTRMWMALRDGAERLGVIAFIMQDGDSIADDGEEARAPGGGASKAATQRDALEELSHAAAQLIMTKTLYGDTIVRLRRSATMGLAAEMQWSLLPPLSFADNRVTIAAGLEPAYHVAGDCVDYAVDGSVARLAIFDGMGHGLSSSQLASLAVAAYRNARRARSDLRRTAVRIDAAIATLSGGHSFSTGVLAELDLDSGVLQWINAGHPPPLLLREGRLVRTLEVEPTMPFGLAEMPDWDVRSMVHGIEQLQPDDMVVLYTDGVIEARAPDGELFGQERLAGIVSKSLSHHLPTTETLRRLVHDLMSHQGGVLSDDATLMLVQWLGSDGRQVSPESVRTA